MSKFPNILMFLLTSGCSWGWWCLCPTWKALRASMCCKILPMRAFFFLFLNWLLSNIILCTSSSTMWRLENVNLVQSAYFTTLKECRYTQLEKIMLMHCRITFLETIRRCRHPLSLHSYTTPRDFPSDRYAYSRYFIEFNFADNVLLNTYHVQKKNPSLF